MRFSPIRCLLLIALFFQFFTSASAAMSGMWRFVHPEIGGVYFRIKSDTTATYFLEEGTVTLVYKGNWEVTPVGLKFSFDNGVVFDATELEEGKAELRVAMQQGHEDVTEEVLCLANSVESRAIGAMTIDPDKDDQDEERIGYFGGWEGELLSGEKFYMQINEDRTAGISHSFSGMKDDSEGFTDVVGFWRKDGEKLQIYWNDGSFTVLETNGRRIEQTSFKAGEMLEEAKGFTSRIIPFRTKDLPEDWYREFKTDYVSRMPIIVLRQNSVIKTFFRGDWIVSNQVGSDDRSSVIELKRFGRAYTNRYGGVKGQWYPGSDTVSIWWRNGVKETIKVVGNQFVVNSFNPNQPLSGRPARIQLASPVDEDKTGYYLNRKKELLDPRRFFKGLPILQKKEDAPEGESESGSSSDS